MSMLNRYFFYTLVFLIVLASLFTQNFALIGGVIIGAILLGFLTEYYDNRRDEKHKHLNANHQYKH